MMVFQFLKSSYSKLTSALARARSFFGTKIQALFQKKIDETTLEQLEQLLYEADFGVKTSIELTNKVRELHKKTPDLKAADYLQAIRSDLEHLLNQYSPKLNSPPLGSPLIMLLVGVNGNGKTTSTAKLAHLFKQNGKKVLIAAADTFRAAATEQLERWAQKLDVDLVKGSSKSDPAAIAFDAVQAAKARQTDVVLVDTAGRLHTKTPLMQELEKIKRSCHKAALNGPHEILLVLDATTGQNAVDQAKQFHKTTPLTGIILTKLDGTAKGGIVVAIQRELGVPIKFIGTGEQLDDLHPFDPTSFLTHLFE